jgi:hypothetical protein
VIATRSRASATETAALKTELRRLTATVQASISAWFVLCLSPPSTQATKHRIISFRNKKQQQRIDDGFVLCRVSSHQQAFMYRGVDYRDMLQFEHLLA